MAKINLTTQHIQDNPSGVAALGVLVCMVITIVGIKLWWFRRRLSFEESSNENGAIGGVAPGLIVPRRRRQQKYKKDKRYSQQIYESVEVHGIFRQKCEDDVEIERPQQLPPVRIRQSSDSTSLMLPPPRTKRRDQVHSTAFEDLEIATPPLTAASSSDLTLIPEINTKISLTFEEFERQFKLKDIKPDVPDRLNYNTEVIEIPVAPLRLIRSSSAITKPEKPQGVLQSSQSIKEFRKVIEKKPSGFSSPNEDLSKIDDYDEIKILENFRDCRPKYYIKYDEIDNDLQEQYKKELNDEIDKNGNQFTNIDISESPTVVDALKALRNECIIYNNDLSESPDAQLSEEYNSNKKPYKWENVEYSGNDFINQSIKSNKQLSPDAVDHEDIKDQTSPQLKQDCKTSGEDFEFTIIKERTTPTMFAKEDSDTDFHPVKEQRPTECIKHSQNDEKPLTIECSTVNDTKASDLVRGSEISGKILINKLQEPNDENSIVTAFKFLNEYSQPIKEAESSTIKDQNPRELIAEPETTNENIEFCDSLSFTEDFDNQFSSWPQFEEKIETPKVNVRKFNNQYADTQGSYDEIKNENPNETNQNIPKSFQKDFVQSAAFNNEYYNETRSFLTTGSFSHSEQREVTFDASVAQKSDNERHSHSKIKERRPTGFIRNSDYFVTFSDESDEDSNHSLSDHQRSSPANIRSNVEIAEIQSSNINFEDNNVSTCPENEMNKFTLNQTKSTGFVSPLSNEESYNDAEYQDDCNDFSKAHVKSVTTTEFKDERDICDSEIKQRRPTGYIKQLDILDLTDEEASLNKEYDVISKCNFEMKEIPKNSPTVTFVDVDESSKDYETNTQCFLKQRRPTGFVRKEELNKFEKQVNFQINDEENYAFRRGNKALYQRRPTGFIRREEITPEEEEKTQIGNEQPKQPTGVVRKIELKCLSQPAPIFHPPNDNTINFDNHLWQELEKELEHDDSENFEEEFSKIRHSYEQNEADFLELQSSPTNNIAGHLVFRKSIKDNCKNFENLKPIVNPSQSPTEIKITFNEEEDAATTSILKEHKLEENVQPNPRKSKVSFDFKTNERAIPARQIQTNNEEDSHYDNDDVCDKLPPPVPPRPMQRVSNINYNNAETPLSSTVTIPMDISLFGSQIPTEDSWSAIRKHRCMTEEFQNLSTDSKLSPTQPALNTPPKPPYRNPMAQLAIQRAKDVRADIDSFKSRSINDRKPETSRRQKQKLLNLNLNDNIESTEA